MIKGWEPLWCGIASHPPADVSLQKTEWLQKLSVPNTMGRLYRRAGMCAYGHSTGECNGWASEPPRAPGCNNTEYFDPGKRHSSYHNITTNGSTSYGLGNREIVVRFTAKARYSSTREVPGPGP